MTTKIAIILEWENAGSLEREAAGGFLRALVNSVTGSQAAQRHPLDLLLVFDESVDGAVLQADLDAFLPERPEGFAVRFLLAPGAAYYPKKGVAAFFSDAQILVYADSDCAYVAGWLDQLIAPLLSREAELTFGETMAARGTTIVEKASSLAWFFSTDAPRDPLHAKGQQRFFANNFAVQADAMRACPPPRHAGSRSHGSMWKQNWERAGKRRVRVPAALARHRQYDKVSELLGRAWLFGKDKDLGNRLFHPGRGYRLARAFAAFFELVFKFLHRFWRAGPALLRPLEVIPVLLLGLAFQLVTAISQMIQAAKGGQLSVTADYGDLVAAARLLPERVVVSQPPSTFA